MRKFVLPVLVGALIDALKIAIAVVAVCCALAALGLRVTFVH